MPKEFIGVNVEKQEKAKLRQLAEKDFRTLADYLRLVIREHLNGKGYFGWEIPSRKPSLKELAGKPAKTPKVEG
jgi:hypothetical protein